MTAIKSFDEISLDELMEINGGDEVTKTEHNEWSVTITLPIGNTGGTIVASAGGWTTTQTTSQTQSASPSNGSTTTQPVYAYNPYGQPGYNWSGN